MGCKGCGSKDPFARVAAAGGKVFDISLPTIKEPKLEDIPFLNDRARAAALAAVAKKGAAFDAPASVVFVQGMRRSKDREAPVTLRASIVPVADALKILAAQPLLAAKVLAKHPEAFELEEGCSCCATAVYVETGGPVAFERLELAA